MKKVILHSGILLVLVVLLNQLGIHSGKVYKDGASIVCEQKRIAIRENKWEIPDGKKTVLYFGASDVLSALVPEVFDSTLNNKTYSLNLALPALPIGPYYHALLDYLENNDPPDYIIMTYHVANEPVLLFDSYANQGIDFPGEVVSYFLYHNGSKNQTINYLLPCHVYRKPMFKFLYNSVAYPSDIEEKRKQNNAIIRKMIEDRGYYFIKEQSRFPEGKLPADYKEKSDCPEYEMKIYEPDGDVFVEKFFNLTKKHNVKVLLISHPARKGKYKQFDELPKVLKELSAKYDHIYFSRNWELPFYENRYFSDPLHLNEKGAMRFTKDIAFQFEKIFNANEPLLTNNKNTGASDSLTNN